MPTANRHWVAGLASSEELWNPSWTCGRCTTGQMRRISNGTASHDTTLGTPSQSVELRQIIVASRTPVADGTEHVMFSNITIYCGGTANVTATQVVSDRKSVV